jgi:hypothetical protein
LVCYALAIVVASQRVRLDLTALMVEQYCQYARRERTGLDEWPRVGRRRALGPRRAPAWPAGPGWHWGRIFTWPVKLIAAISLRNSDRRATAGIFGRAGADRR